MSIYFTIGCNSNPNGWEDITRGFEFALYLDAKGVDVHTLTLTEAYLVHTGWHENSHKMMVAGTDKTKMKEFSKKAGVLFDELMDEHFESDEFGYNDYDDNNIEVFFPEFIKRLKTIASSLEVIDENQQFYKVVFD